MRTILKWLKRNLAVILICAWAGGVTIKLTYNDSQHRVEQEEIIKLIQKGRIHDTLMVYLYMLNGLQLNQDNKKQTRDDTIEVMWDGLYNSETWMENPSRLIYGRLKFGNVDGFSICKGVF